MTEWGGEGMDDGCRMCVGGWLVHAQRLAECWKHRQIDSGADGQTMVGGGGIYR